MTEPEFRLSRVSGFPVKDDDLIVDLKRVAELLEGSKITQAQYGKQ